jgi:hypothetical protein
VSVGLIVVASFAALISIGAQSPTDPSIKKAVVGAVADIRDAATYKTPWTAGSLPAAARQAMHTTLATRMSQNMAGKALVHWKGILDAAIDRDSDGAHVIVTAGGVDKSEFDPIVIDGTHATASGRMHTWVTWVIHDQSVPGPHAGRPNGWDVFEASLDEVGGQWYVTDLTLQPEFGG